ncbi:MAG: hypothetical protein HYT06_01490, partial [Candidatus Levybacteria bacterium]|nr:hypothetical protein [Candidatus Levybacteria bacterium]
MLITIASVSTIAFVVSTQIPLSQIKQEEEQTLTNISALHDKLTTYYLVKDRINNINNLLNIRENYITPIDTVLGKVNEQLSINAFSIEKNKMTLTLSASSLVPISETINAIYDLGKEKKIISDVKLTSLGLDTQGGRYIVTLQAKIL